MSELGGNSTERSNASLTRRQMLTRSAVAGGLVWAAPTLMSTPAGAQTKPVGCECLGGIEATVKIPSNPNAAINCGVSCLSQAAYTNLPCLTSKSINLGCLWGTYITLATNSFVNGQVRTAVISLTGGIVPLAIGVKMGSPDCCVYAECADDYVNYHECSPAPTLDVIEVAPGSSADETLILINTSGRPLNHMELALCIPNALTGACP